MSALVVGVVHEVAHEQDAAEQAPEIELLDSRKDRLGAVHVFEHCRIHVDRDDAPAERGERVGDPARPAAEIEDGLALTGLAVDQLRFACRLEDLVEPERGARIQRGSRHTPRAVSTRTSGSIRMSLRMILPCSSSTRYPLASGVTVSGTIRRTRSPCSSKTR